MGPSPPDDTDRPAAPDDRADPDDATEGKAGTSAGTRDVVVPLPLYKVIVVFSTLLAVVGVVAGFITLDAATRRATAPASTIDPVLVILGLALIAGGGLVYVFAARFRTAGMGTDKTEGGERGNDG